MVKGEKASLFFSYIVRLSTHTHPCTQPSLKNLTQAVGADLASKANATKAFLQAVDKQDAKQLAAGGVQSVAVTKRAAALLAATYKLGSRTFGYDVKNTSQRVALEDYTTGRLRFETELRAGERGRGGGGGANGPF